MPKSGLEKIVRTVSKSASSYWHHLDVFRQNYEAYKEHRSPMDALEIAKQGIALFYVGMWKFQEIYNAFDAAFDMKLMVSDLYATSLGYAMKTRTKREANAQVNAQGGI